MNEEKCRAKLDAAERKIEMLKRAIVDADTQNLDLRHRVQRFVELLGFSNINEAQRAFDMANHEVTFRQSFQRLQILEDEVQKERMQNEDLQRRCHELEELFENERKRSATLEKDEQRCQQELSDLKVQYDALLDKSRRAQQIFTRDRRKFYGIYEWLCLEPLTKKKKSNLPDEIDFGDQNTQYRRAILREFGSDLSKLLGLDVEMLDRMMQAARGTAPSEGCQVAGRQPFSIIPVNSILKSEPVKTSHQFNPLQSPLNAKSSDTEEDPEALSQLFHIPLPLASPNACLANSSDTEEDSQAPRPFLSSPDIPPPTTPISAMRLARTKSIHAQPPLSLSFNFSKGTPDTASLHFPVKSEPEDEPGTLDHERSAKKPRLSLDFTIQTPKPKTNFVSRHAFSTSRMTKEKGHYTDENTPVGSNALFIRSSGQTRMEDYAAFKGRGRYGKEGQPARKIINATFNINPARNGGLSHQYEEVVRNKGERTLMDAGECENCRDWYAAVGPLPLRNRGPLWRSPSATPVKRCNHHGAIHSPERDISPSPSVRNQAEIDLHRKQVSRHRQNWARAKTPPGYWSIGFPSTQEARDINEKAEEMHQRKFREVEKEAEQGRWIRR